MSVTILPYIDEVNKANTVDAKSSGTDIPSDAVLDSFREVLAAAERTQQAMAVDALLAAESSGSISPATIQKLLGFNPQPNIPATRRQHPVPDRPVTHPLYQAAQLPLLPRRIWMLTSKKLPALTEWMSICLKRLHIRNPISIRMQPVLPVQWA